MRAILPLIALTLAACSSATPFRLSNIAALNEPEQGVSTQGLEFLADTTPDKVKPRINVAYLHGIGWTEDPDLEALGQEFLDGIAEAYGLEDTVAADGKCLNAAQGPVGPSDDLIYIHAPEPIRLETSIPGTFLTLDRLACVDKHVLAVSDTLDIAVYRIFWDDAFWNGVQFAHVGQDDDQGSSAEFAALRRRFNRQFKDELVNYGFSDAVMYLGPTGQTIREAVRGALCAAALDAGGVGFATQGPETSTDLACNLRQNTSVLTNAFAFVSESLGSKIFYDLFRDALTDGRDGPLDALVAGAEHYMLANQLPLLSLSDVTQGQTRAAPALPAGERPTIIALSEPNDFLTYEILPFLQNIWRYSDHQDARDFSDPALREEIAARLGFDVVDVRVEFADPLVPFVRGLVDPLQAHKSHAGEPEIIRLILCGLQDGDVREAGCLAAQ